MQNPPLALMLQCCPLDALAAERLVEILAMVETRPRSDVEFFLAVRRDVDPDQAKAIINVAKQAFGNAKIIESRRWGVGWPAGCNDLWQDAMMQLGEMKLWTEAEKPLRANGIFTFEPDCVPLRPDWVTVLKDAWNLALSEGKQVLGYKYPPEADIEHINGNAIFVPEIMRMNFKLCSSRLAWDTEHRLYFLEIGKHTDLIEQRYQRDFEVKDYGAYIRQIARLPHRPAILHGLKSPKALAAVRAAIECGEFWNWAEDNTCATT